MKLGPGADAIKIRKLRIRKNLVRFVDKIKIYSSLKRSGFLRIRSLRIFIASATGVAERELSLFASHFWSVLNLYSMIINHN